MNSVFFCEINESKTYSVIKKEEYLQFLFCRVEPFKKLYLVKTFLRTWIFIILSFDDSKYILLRRKDDRKVCNLKPNDYNKIVGIFKNSSDATLYL